MKDYKKKYNQQKWLRTFKEELLKMQMYDTSYCKKLFVKISELSAKMHIVDDLPSIVSIENGLVLPRKLGKKKGGGGTKEERNNIIP